MDRDELFYSGFDQGASRIQWSGSIENEESSINQNQKIGHLPDPEYPNDTNGSCFWSRKTDMDPIWDCHDAKIAEQELGFNEGDVRGRYYRIDDNDTSNHNYHIATGYEKGANENYTGIDPNTNEPNPELYPGTTSGGQPEMVSDPVPTNEVTICPKSESRVFNRPCEDEAKLSVKAEDIKAKPDGPEKQVDLEKWNKEASALDEQLGKCQDYVDSRCEDHRQTLENYGEGTKQHEIASNCLNNYEPYSQELGEAQLDLRAQYASLNEGTEYNPSEPIPPHHKEDMTCLYGQSEGSGKDPTQLQGNEDMSCLYGNATGNTASVGQGLGDSVMNNNYGVSL